MRTPDESGDGLDTRRMKGSLEQRLFGAAPDPVRVGRFVVIDRLGQGGMGTVFRAYDPDLDRRVALKVLNKTTKAEPEREARLVREAQALAKLNHPNVVAVHEVGLLVGRIFVAMEHVEGKELGAWARTLPPPGLPRYRQALEILIQAGSGLAAAHAAGLVHRDFKPTNVLVGDDGRARVLDFGLARQEHGDRSSVDDDAPTLGSISDTTPDPTQGPTPQVLTETGAVVGTPAYMAPEQWERATVSPRADQFAFCLTAWEVLFGARPWDGKLPGPSDEIRLPRQRSATARHLVRCLKQGLAAEPEQRHAGMAPLLAALRHDPELSRRRWGRIGAAAVVAVALAGGYAVQRSRRCDDIEPLLAATSPQSIEAGFVETGDPDAQASFERAWSGLTRYGEAWTSMAQQACRAAKIDGELSHESYTLTQRCLENRRRRTDALLEAFAAADRPVVRRSVQAVEAMPNLATCSDPDRVRAEAPLPDDSELRDGVREVRAAMARASAQWATGSLDRARELFDGLTEHVAVRQYGPLRAELQSHRGGLAEVVNDDKVARASLEEAYWTGLEFRHDSAAARAARKLAVHFASRNQLDAADRWIKSAQTLTRRADAGDRELALLFGAEAEVEGRHGRLDEAETRIQRARALSVDAPVQRAMYGRNLATIFLKQARFDEGLAQLLLVKEALARELGADHLELAVVHHNIGGVQIELGHPEQAKTSALHGLEIRLRAHGPEHPSIASSYEMLGRAEYRAGKPALAKPHFQRAMDIAVASRPPGDPLIGRTKSSLAAAHNDLGEYGEALSVYRELARTHVELLGEDHPRTGRSYRDIGWTLTEMGKHAEALAPLKKADAVFIKTRGPAHGQTLDHRRLLGRTLRMVGRDDEALALFDAAIPQARTNADARPELVGLLGERAVVRLQSGQTAGALADSEEAVKLAHTLSGKTPELCIAVFQRVTLLVDAGRHKQAATLAAETLADASLVARPQDRANLLFAHARALQPHDPERSRSQAEAVKRIYSDAGANVPDEVTALLPGP